MRKFVRPLMALMVLLLLPAPSAVVAQQVPASSAQTLRPGDIVRLRIWREPDLSGEFPVDEAGVVVFPRLGEYSVVTETPETLADRLVADYRQYLVNPSIEITVLRRIRIVGAVTNPGLYPVDPTFTVADAVAAAGGATPIGDQNKIRIIRDGQEIAVNIRADTRIADSPIQSGDQIFVPERSWVTRNSGLVAATMSATVSLIIALIIR